jgi:hypothetical protein
MRGFNEWNFRNCRLALQAAEEARRAAEAEAAKLAAQAAELKRKAEDEALKVAEAEAARRAAEEARKLAEEEAARRAMEAEEATKAAVAVSKSTQNNLIPLFISSILSIRLQCSRHKKHLNRLQFPTQRHFLSNHCTTPPSLKETDSLSSAG